MFDDKQVLEAIQKAVEANPNGKNPMDGDMCLNRARVADAPTPRCIASQVHYDLTGRELLGSLTVTIHSSLDETYWDGEHARIPFTPAAVDLLRDAQNTFDASAMSDGDWSAALAEFMGR